MTVRLISVLALTLALTACGVDEPLGSRAGAAGASAELVAGAGGTGASGVAEGGVAAGGAAGDGVAAGGIATGGAAGDGVAAGGIATGGVAGDGVAGATALAAAGSAGVGGAPMVAGAGGGAGGAAGIDQPEPLDSDGDGLSDALEAELGTNPLLVDSDGDGLDDRVEVEVIHSDPRNPDTDGDTLSDGDEVRGGTLPTRADTDGDGLSDSAETSLGTDPCDFDTDDDGLSDFAEQQAGTLPLVFDSDGEGWSDGEEIFLQTDPLDPFSWDFGGERWPDLSAGAAGLSSSEYALGQLMPDFTVYDQYGGPVTLYQMYGYVVMVVISAGFCPHCQSESAGLQAVWEQYRAQGLMIVQIMLSDYAGVAPASLDFRQTWASTYGLEFPVTGEGDAMTVRQGLYDAGLYAGSIPYFLLLRRDLRIDRHYTGGGQDFEAGIVELLGP